MEAVLAYSLITSNYPSQLQYTVSWRRTVRHHNNCTPLISYNGNIFLINIYGTVFIYVFNLTFKMFPQVLKGYLRVSATIKCILTWKKWSHISCECNEFTAQCNILYFIRNILLRIRMWDYRVERPYIFSYFF